MSDRAADTASSLITEAMRDAAGTELERSVSYPISASDIRRWVLAVYHPAEPPREFWDVEYAEAGPNAGIVAPDEFNPFAWMAAQPPGLKPDYGPGGPSLEERLGLAPVATRFMLNGGVRLEYGALMRPGDVITATGRLGRYWQRAGRLGQMLFSTTVSRWENQRGEVVKSVTNTLIRY
jgi:hypothetical protein